jgi:AI-2 transport protein TqsA
MNSSDRELTKTFQIIMILAGLVILIQGMMFAQSIIVPFMMAIIIAIICEGASNWLQDKGFPAWLATIVIIVTSVLVCFFSILLVEKSMIDFSKNIPSYGDKLSQLAGRFEAFAGTKGIHLEGKDLTHILRPESVLQYAEKFFKGFSSLFEYGFFIFLAVVFILSESGSFSAKIANIPGESEKRIKQLEKFTKSVRQYMLVKGMVSLLTGALVSISLVIIGVDYPFLWGMLAFAFNFVPNIGSIMAAIPAILLAAVQLGPLSAALASVCYLFINICVGNFIEPRFMGKKLGLSMLVVFLSLVFWGWALGPVGMLLSVILTMKVKIILDSSDNTRWLGALLGPSHPETKE